MKIISLFFVFALFAAPPCFAADPPELFAAGKGAEPRLERGWQKFDPEAFRSGKFRLRIEGREHLATPLVSEIHENGDTSAFFRVDGALDISNAVIAPGGRIAAMAVALPGKDRDEWFLVNVPLFGAVSAERADAAAECQVARRSGRPKQSDPQPPFDVAANQRRRAVEPSMAIPVMHVYPAKVISATGTAADLRLRVQVMINQFNLTAAASGYPGVRLRNAFDGVFDIDLAGGLDDLQTLNDNQAIREVRRVHRAAIVVGFTPDGKNYASLPEFPEDFNPQSAYATVSLAASLYMYVHELGHIFGMFHDTTEKPLLFAPHRLAYVNGETWQTVMGQARHPTNGIYPMIFRFSNPATPYGNLPTGTPERFNAWALEYGRQRIELYPYQLP